MAAAPLQFKLIHLSRRTKRAVMMGLDALVLICAFGVAIALADNAGSRIAYLPLLGLALMVALPTFAQQGLYRAVIRFIGARVVFGALRSVSITALCVAGAGILFGVDATTAVLATVTVFWAFSLLGVIGMRFMARVYLLHQATPGERVAIYGAGEAGARLATALMGGQDFSPVVFVDDNVAIEGRVINGLPVHHPDLLPQLVTNLRIKRVLLAMPSVSRHQRRQIISRLESLNIHVQTMPDFADLVSGNARVDEIREVDVADLLGRDAIAPRDRLLDACIRGKSVIVTGAGGSIGSELCRQIIRLKPTRLLLFEISELALYTIEQELRRLAELEGYEVEIVALLGSVHHRERVRNVLRTYRVDTLYHAAAYKHVPMVEHNMVEGIHNNIIGTWYTAEAAADAGVETFVLISTDKAVSPVNVMGATKRMAEMVLQALSERGSDTRFCMVRFGNVLASSGSVVPLFRDQIRAGGPVTVTHPEIIRYFMTIPEAAQLVIQAGSMSTGGDVFVLDMGKPVRIEDLARRMINLMGLTVRDADNPDGDIEISYTGLRPAEKLYEELLIGNNVTGTEHPMIMRALEEFLPWSELLGRLEKMLLLAREFDCERARALLLDTVSGYTPSNGVEDLVWREAQAAGVLPRAAQVTELASRRPGSLRPGN